MVDSGRVIPLTYPERRALIASIAVEHRYSDLSTGAIVILDHEGGAVLKFIAVKELPSAQ